MTTVNCQDLVEFQRLLNSLRVMEDKIIFELNCRLPRNSTASQSNVNEICKDIKTRLNDLRKNRADLLQGCIKENQDIISKFHNDPERVTETRNSHNIIRLLKNEGTVDEIATAQTDKTVYERCRKAELLS